MFAVKKLGMIQHDIYRLKFKEKSKIATYKCVKMTNATDNSLDTSVEKQ